METRKRNRLPDYNYATPGYYFLTVCTQNRQPLFWKSMDSPAQVTLSPVGQLVDEEIKNLSRIYPSVWVDHYCIMPDHLHMILELTMRNSVSISRLGQRFKGSLTKKMDCSVWQKSYFDHVIRNEAEYRARWQYVDENPRKYLTHGYRDPV